MPPPKTKVQAVPLISSNKQAIAGFLAGFTSTALTYPLDLIKTRFQSSHYKHYTSPIKAAKSIVSTHGIRGLIVGIEVSIIGSSVAWGSYFYLYSNIKNKFRILPTDKLTASQHLMSSFSAGFITQFVTNPIWVIKTNSQLNKSYKIMENVEKIYSSRGITGFWRGVIPSLFGIFQASIHFMVYEQSKYIFQDKYKRYMSSVEVIANTIFAKTIAVAATYPYQVVRTRLHHIDGESTKLLPLFKFVWEQNGIKGFYKGMSVNIARIMPSTCITFLVYETMKTKL